MGTAVTVLRTGPIIVSAADNFVYFTLPVQMTFGYLAFESYPLRAGLRFRAKFDVTPDWRIKTELYYTGLSDNLADTFNVGPLSMKPKGMVENISKPLQRLLAPIIDTKVNNSVQLRAKVEPLWQSAFSPKLVNRDFSAWLKLNPDRIVMSPLRTANNRIQLAIGLMTGAEITVGPEPAAAPVRPLPPVQHLPAFDRSFHIRLAADIYFADLVNALNPVLLDKTFGDDRKITVKGFTLKGEEGRLVVVLNATGDFDGELTVLARPVYNQEKNALTFEDVDFDTRNAGWLVTSGSWLFKSAIRSTIKEKLDAAVVDELEKARLKASSALSSVQINQHARLTGTVASLSLGEAKALNDRLSVNVVAQGELGVNLK